MHLFECICCQHKQTTALQGNSQSSIIWATDNQIRRKLIKRHKLVILSQVRTKSSSFTPFLFLSLNIIHSMSSLVGQIKIPQTLNITTTIYLSSIPFGKFLLPANSQIIINCQVKRQNQYRVHSQQLRQSADDVAVGKIRTIKCHVFYYARQK